MPVSPEQAEECQDGATALPYLFLWHLHQVKELFHLGSSGIRLHAHG